MRPLLACLVSLLGLQAAAAPAAGEDAPSRVSIRFRDQSVVDGETIRLGDIARIMAGSGHAVAELETLEVAKSAAFGLTRMLDTDILYARFLKPWAGRYAIDYDGKVIKVATRSEKLAPDSLARLLESFVASQPKRRGEIRRWEIARAPAEILVPATAHSLELAYAGARRRGKVELTLSISTPARVLRHIPIAINLRVEEPVLVAKRTIERDMPLDAGNTAVEMRETTLMDDAVAASPEKLLGYLAKVTLNPGRIVTARMVAMPPVVKRGQEAKILYRNGGVSITADAVCRQDGLPGQIITAKSLASHRLVRVRVTEDGWLEPVPGG